MNKLFRLLSLAAVGGGSLLIGWACYEGWVRGFNPDLELANWDPVIEGAIGACILALGVISYLYFGYSAKGRGRRHALAVAIRILAVKLLEGCEMLGVAAGVSAFIVFLALERSQEGSGSWALGVLACAVVTHCSARFLLPWARGEKPPPKETSVGTFNDREGPD